MPAAVSSVVGTANYTGGAIREDLASWISDISRTETPFMSSIGTSKATNPRHEWSTHELRSPQENAQYEAFSFDTANAVTVTVDRLSNYTQVFGETIDIGGSLLESDTVGAANWFAQTMEYRARELRRDVEFQALRYDPDTPANAADVGYKSTQTATGTNPGRHFGSIFAYAYNWLRAPGTGSDATTVRTVNIDGSTFGTLTTTAGVGFNVSSATNAPQGNNTVQFAATPTNVSLTYAHIQSLLETMYTAGGKPNMCQVPTGLRAHVSNLLINGGSGVAERRAGALDRKVNSGVDSFMTDFNFDIDIMPNYIMQNDSGAENTVVFYDSDMCKKAVLSGLRMEMDGTARYGKAAIMSEDCTLEFRNPNSNGIIIGVSA